MKLRIVKPGIEPHERYYDHARMYFTDDTVEVDIKQAHYDYLKATNMLRAWTSTDFEMFQGSLEKAITEKLEE